VRGRSGEEVRVAEHLSETWTGSIGSTRRAGSGWHKYDVCNP